MKLMDAHIHLDYYKDHEIEQIINVDHVEVLVSVSSNLDSCKRNLILSEKYPKVKPAFGFHPEQPLPSETEFYSLITWIEKHRDQMIAVGEVGLPYYMRKDNKFTKKQNEQYIEILETFMKLTKKWDKPIVLHAIYEDAPMVCDLLEKYSIEKAHFHWFKGDKKTIERMVDNGYFISVTPEVVYREKIQKLVQVYPIEQMMVETDGPWPFDGPFSGKMTEPCMMVESIAVIAKIKKWSEMETAQTLLWNTKEFYKV